MDTSLLIFFWMEMYYTGIYILKPHIVIVGMFLLSAYTPHTHTHTHTEKGLLGCLLLHTSINKYLFLSVTFLLFLYNLFLYVLT